MQSLTNEEIQIIKELISNRIRILEHQSVIDKDEIYKLHQLRLKLKEL